MTDSINNPVTGKKKTFNEFLITPAIAILYVWIWVIASLTKTRFTGDIKLDIEGIWR